MMMIAPSCYRAGADDPLTTQIPLESNVHGMCGTDNVQTIGRYVSVESERR
jgi:hypothetical protein